MFKWEKVYTVEKCNNSLFSKYAIIFEETKIFTSRNVDDAFTICAALNGAFNLGKIEGQRIAGS